MKHIKWNKKFNQLRRLENPRYRFYIYKGGRGGGKSHQIAIALLSIAQSAKKRILCTREIQGTIEHSVHK